MSLKDKEKQNKKEKRRKDSNLLYDFVKVTGGIPALVWLRPRIIYVGKKRRYKDGALIASNHVGAIDPILIFCAFWYRRPYCIAAKELYLKRWNAFFFSHMHCIKIDRQNVDTASIRETTDRLKEGKLVVIFPEGEIKTKENNPVYKAGAILIAFLANKPIIPVHIIKGEKWWNRNTIIIGEPIDVHELCGPIPSQSAMLKASEHLREIEENLSKYYHKTRRNKK